jgi:hypothetical protein
MSYATLCGSEALRVYEWYGEANQSLAVHCDAACYDALTRCLYVDSLGEFLLVATLGLLFIACMLGLNKCLVAWDKEVEEEEGEETPV